MRSPAPRIGDEHDELIADDVGTRVPGSDQPGALDDVHLGFVGADEDIDRCTVDDLPRQDIRAGEVEGHLRPAAGAIRAATSSSASVTLTAAETVRGDAALAVQAASRRSTASIARRLYRGAPAGPAACQHLLVRFAGPHPRETAWGPTPMLPALASLAPVVRGI